jgi:hypothetical protein
LFTKVKRSATISSSHLNNVKKYAKWGGGAAYPEEGDLPGVAA